jgi:hypothetical protein
MFDKTKRDVESAFEFAEQLVSADPIDCQVLVNDSIPRSRGVYFFRSKQDYLPMYIGSGVGKRGLFGRIARGHLSKTYKSVLKKYLMEENGFTVEQALEFMKKTFNISFLALPNHKSSFVSLVEHILIYEHRPKYNRQFNDKSEPLSGSCEE